jgi:ubiquinone/menaquinone biosynthesis C-methylase UbiE
MNQEKIWEHFQNDAIESFSGSLPRMKFLCNQLKPNERVLNIGVGNGSLEYLALKKGVDIYCLDPSEKSIDNLFNKLGVSDKFRVGYSQNIPFPDDFFNAVIMSEVLEHLSEKDFNETLKEVKRVLKNSGKFLITVPFEEVLATNEVICPNCEEVFHRWGHQQSFTIKRLKQLLQDNNFIISKASVRCFPDWSRKSLTGVVKSFVRHIMGRLGVGLSNPNIFLIAKK